MEKFKEGWMSFWNGMNLENSWARWFGWVVGFWVLQFVVNVFYEVFKWLVGLK